MEPSGRGEIITYGELGDGTHDRPVILLFKCRVSVRWSPSLRVMTIVWRSKATEPSGRGETMYGQLGDGRTTSRYPPVQVQGLDSVAAIAAGVAPIVWRSKATEPSGLGDIMVLATRRWNNDRPLYSRTSSRIWRVSPTPEAPQWPEGDVLTVTDVTYNSVQLNWQPATDETGVDKYLVYQDNTLLATLNGDVNSYEVKGLSPKFVLPLFIGRRRCRWQSKCEKRSDGHYCSIYGSRLFSAFRFQNLFIRRIQL